jgi:hypothetical protein
VGVLLPTPAGKRIGLGEDAIIRASRRARAICGGLTSGIRLSVGMIGYCDQFPTIVPMNFL